MKLLHFYIFGFFIFASCKTPLDKLKEQMRHDSIQNVANHIVDSIKAKVEHDDDFDSVGSANCGVIILKMRLIKSDGGNYKNVALTYKNISGKKIKAVRFKWYGETAFGDPADMGHIFDKGFGVGFDDSGLGINSISNGEWDILSQDAKTILYAWPIEIAFADGTKWKSTFKIN